jgi:2-polyprenyl-3-methyl-5-hydroxy-6-metoxy-1,4-benzoquinol methylase
MERHQDATLLGGLHCTALHCTALHCTDIGCNIGMYTVVAAALGRQVVAVDADPHNLAYIRK